MVGIYIPFSEVSPYHELGFLIDISNKAIFSQWGYLAVQHTLIVTERIEKVVAVISC